MSKTKPPGMEHLSRIIGGRLAPVQGISEERISEMFKVNTNLVGASGVERAFDERAGAQLLQDTVFGFRRASPRGFDDRHLFAMHRMPADGGLDKAASFL